MVACGQQRRDAVVAGLAYRCTSLEQQPSDLEVALVTRLVQRRDAVMLASIDRRASFKE